MTFYRAILQNRHEPRKVVKIQATTLLGAKREAYKNYAGGLLEDACITLESWDGTTLFTSGDKAWIEVCYLSLGYGNRAWVRM